MLENIYKGSEILDPDTFCSKLNELKEISAAVSRSNGELLTIHAASFYKLYSSLVDSYTKLWEKNKVKV